MFDTYSKLAIHTQYSRCQSSLYKLKKLQLKKKKLNLNFCRENLMEELAAVSRCNVKNEPSNQRLILRYCASSIPIPCGASTLRHRYRSTRLRLGWKQSGSGGWGVRMGGGGGGGRGPAVLTSISQCRSPLHTFRSDTRTPRTRQLQSHGTKITLPNV